MTEPCQIGVQGRFSASHNDRRSGAVHGHDYLVTAWFDGATGEDARDLELGLQSLLTRHLDHRMLPDGLASMEAIRAYILRFLPGVEDVEVDRPILGFKVRGRRQ